MAIPASQTQSMGKWERHASNTIGTFQATSRNIILKYYKLIDILNGKNEKRRDFYYNLYRETLSFKN